VGVGGLGVRVGVGVGPTVGVAQAMRVNTSVASTVQR